MATASSLQREPSMEEILASIRRIIEDSDTGRKPAGETEELRQDLERLAQVDAVSEAEASRVDPYAAANARKPVTLAEIQSRPPAAEPTVARNETPARFDPGTLRPSLTLAQVGASIAPEPAAVEQAPLVRPVATSDSIVADWRREIAAVGEQAKPLPDRSDSRGSLVQPEVVSLRDEPIAKATFEQAPSSENAERPVAEEASSTRPAIVSEHTGRQVAAAFGELSDAFASRSKKTFDEMAEEMLRPMLQDWLDNNLPTLVERLVREEIERVARGAQ
ncbi:PopZ family protein [Mesorhizobium sp. ES1-1]|uniref:PopZ family protein n=1 Tax=Mesorhizobium sp. ES1-1 TaxID=2876629 RepID=UPI001CCE20CF|nr:PopZ family protein [Mesorhizobium sp. ES1-1]MBZ9677245.1 PopZ family protein [Mesorhizobium sp. ES1-1]